MDILATMPAAMNTFNIVVYKFPQLEDLYRIGKAAMQTKSTETMLTAIKLLLTLFEQCRELEIPESELIELLWSPSIKLRDDPQRVRDKTVKKQQEMIVAISMLVMETAEGVIDNKTHPLRPFFERQLKSYQGKWSKAIPDLKTLLACYIQRLRLSYNFPADAWKRWSDVLDDDILVKANPSEAKNNEVKAISPLDQIGKY